jgi:hypothetical protein
MRASGTRAQTVTVQPFGRVRVRESGSAPPPWPAGTRSVVWVSAAGGVAVDPDGAAAPDEAEEADGEAGAVEGAEVGCSPEAPEPPQAAVTRLAVTARVAALRYRRVRMATTVGRRPEAARPDT